MEAPATYDRLRWLLTVAVVIGAAGLAFWWLAPKDQDPAALLPANTMAAPGRTNATEEPRASIGVDVVGAVQQPGLYYLERSARVEDAIAAAGGLAPDADREAVNLAARVLDEQQIRVPRIGEAMETGGSAPPPAAAQPLNLNTADLAALDALPGIGPVMAQRIVEYRTAHGPFRSVEQLQDVSGIGEATLEGLRELVIVKP